MPLQDDKLGALWFKTSAKGDYFTGEITVNGTKEKLVLFANRYKDAENKPDWIIFKSRPKDAAV